MLSIQYPMEYASVFQPLIDFEVINASKWLGGDFVSPHKEVWIDFSEGGINKVEGIPHNVEILDFHLDPVHNLMELAKHERKEGVRRVCLLQCAPRYISLLYENCDLLAVPNNALPARSIYVNLLKSCHYHGFCNLDELRNRPPLSIHTDIPITAAMAGIDLRRRERRPKKLPEFSYDIKLTPERLELAVENTKAIREALNEGRNRTLST